MNFTICNSGARWLGPKGPVFRPRRDRRPGCAAFAKPILGSRPPAEPARRSGNGNKGRVTQEQWTAVDRYLNNLLVPSDPRSTPALEASADAGLPAIKRGTESGEATEPPRARQQRSNRPQRSGRLAPTARSGSPVPCPLPGGSSRSKQIRARRSGTGKHAGAGLSEVVEILVGPAADPFPKA